MGSAPGARTSGGAGLSSIDEQNVHASFTGSLSGRYPAPLASGHGLGIGPWHEAAIAMTWEIR